MVKTENTVSSLKGRFANSFQWSMRFFKWNLVFKTIPSIGPRFTPSWTPWARVPHKLELGSVKCGCFSCYLKIVKVPASKYFSLQTWPLYLGSIAVLLLTSWLGWCKVGPVRHSYISLNSEIFSFSVSQLAGRMLPWVGEYSVSLWQPPFGQVLCILGRTGGISHSETK